MIVIAVCNATKRTMMAAQVLSAPRVAGLSSSIRFA